MHYICIKNIKNSRVYMYAHAIIVHNVMSAFLCSNFVRALSPPQIFHYFFLLIRIFFANLWSKQKQRHTYTHSGKPNYQSFPPFAIIQPWVTPILMFNVTPDSAYSQLSIWNISGFSHNIEFVNSWTHPSSIILAFTPNPSVFCFLFGIFLNFEWMTLNSPN